MINRRPLTDKEALMLAEDACARAEYCSYEIRERLRRRGVAPDVIGRIIESLESRRYIDDRRYAMAFARSRQQYNGWGRRKIALALSAKRISRDLIDEALEQIDPDEYVGALAGMVTRWAASMKRPLSREDRMKLVRRALGRGYDYDSVREAMRAIDSDDTDDEEFDCGDY